MTDAHLVGAVLVAGFVVFFAGAAGWRLAYEQPLREALRAIHRDRRRRAWIHLWMMAGMFPTSSGLFGLALVTGDGTAGVLAPMGPAVFAVGAVCWIMSLAFRLTVVPWAAERTETDGDPPDGFAALDSWSGSLYVVHMASAYAAFAILGAAVLTAGSLPSWVGWLGVGWGLVFLAGFVATRFAGPFNPPI